MQDLTIAAIAQNLRKKTYSAVELTKFFLNRIQQLDPKLNSFITVTAEEALKAAHAADQMLQQGATNLLTGIPIAYKDNFYTQGIKTTCASKLLQNFYPTNDATVVSKLKAAGTIICGKTNMDEFAMGSSNETSFFGSCKNPWNLDCVPGGSSGGSAAAVAARLIPFATGTDTGGSTRQPAAFCGICGLKPTFGCISKAGIIPFSTSLDHVGLFATTAEDLEIVLAEITGLDLHDPTSIASKYEPYQKPAVKGLKIGLPREYFQAAIDNEILQALNTAIALLEQQGAIITEISLPNSKIAVPTYCIIADAECANSLRNIDNVDVKTRSNALGAEVKRRMLTGEFMQAGENATKYLLQAQKVRRLIYNDFKTAFAKVDILLAPTTPSIAFKTGTKNHDPIKMYWSDMFTVAGNLAGVPALSIPIGFTQNLPIGMQLIGNHFCENQILSVAKKYQELTDWHKKKVF